MTREEKYAEITNWVGERGWEVVNSLLYLRRKKAENCPNLDLYN